MEVTLLHLHHLVLVDASAQQNPETRPLGLPELGRPERGTSRLVAIVDPAPQIRGEKQVVRNNR